MNKIPRNPVPSHADFDLTPLGMWAIGRDATTSIRGEPHLPPTLLSLKRSLCTARASARTKNRRVHLGILVSDWRFQQTHFLKWQQSDSSHYTGRAVTASLLCS
jgi:hypothetical protein